MAKLHVGEKMPDFTFHTGFEEGKTVYGSLKGKTVFWVLRYIGCPVCRYDVHMIAQRYDEFLAKGAQVFVVMQSDPEHVRNDLKATDATLPFDIICDEKLEIYNALSIEPAESMEALGGCVMDRLMVKGGKARELGFEHGDYEGNEQQLPAMFIVAEDGTVLYAHYAENIMDMPTVDEVLAML